MAKGASVFAGRRGEAVASPLVTVIDDGTMSQEWGWYRFDDEGRPAQRNVLIEDGVLTDYLWDGLRARKEGRASSGNGRRQSYRHLPMVRMTNTYIGTGDARPDDIIASVDHGVYVAQLGGGQVNTATGDFVFGMTEAYLIEDGQLTAPLRDGNLIGNGPDGAGLDRRGGRRLRHGRSRHLRQGRPGRARRHRHADPAGAGAHHRRDGVVSDSRRRRAGRAGPARSPSWPRWPSAGWARRSPASSSRWCVGRSTSTTVRAYQGEVESFTSATNYGLGIRVIVDGRQGFAHAGTFDEAVIKETLADARDNATFAQPDEWAGLATPDGVEPVHQELWSPASRRHQPPSARSSWRSRSSGPRWRSTPGCGACGSAPTATARASSRWPRRSGLRAANRSSSCWTSVSALAEADGETQIGYGVDVGRDPERARPRGGRLRGGHRGHPAARCPQGAVAAGGAAARAEAGGHHPRHRRRHAHRRRRREAALAVRRPARPGGGVPAPHPGRRPHRRPLDLGADSHDGEGLACRRNVAHRGRGAAALPAQQLHRPPQRHRLHRLGRARLPQPAVASASRPWPPRPAPRRWEELLAGVDLGLMVQSMNGLHSGVNPISGDFSVGRRGPDDPARRAGRAGAGGHGRLDAAAAARRHRGGGLGDRVAAVGRRLRRRCSSARSPSPAPDARRPIPRTPRSVARSWPAPNTVGRRDPPPCRRGPPSPSRRAAGRGPGAGRPPLPHDVVRRLDHDAGGDRGGGARVRHRRPLRHRPQRHQGGGGAGRAPRLPGDHRRGGQEPGGGDHRPLPRGAHPLRPARSRGVPAHPRPGRHRLRAPSLRPAAQLPARPTC